MAGVKRRQIAVKMSGSFVTSSNDVRDEAARNGRSLTDSEMYELAQKKAKKDADGIIRSIIELNKALENTETEVVIDQKNLEVNLLRDYLGRQEYRITLKVEKKGGGEIGTEGFPLSFQVDYANINQFISAMNQAAEGAKTNTKKIEGLSEAAADQMNVEAELMARKILRENSPQR